MSRSIWIVGAGHMGRSSLAILAAHDDAFSFTVVDRSDESLAAAAAIAPRRVHTQRVDVATEGIDPRGADVVLNMAGPFFEVSTRIAEASLAAGVAYIDIADDVEATEAVLALDERAQDAGTSLVTGAGLSPGVSNWLAGDLLSAHPAADGIRIAWVTHEPDPGGLAPLRHMLHMAVNPAVNLVDGALRESVGFRPITARSYLLPDPVGPIEAFDTAHPEPLTLSRAYPALRSASCQGALQPQWANEAFTTLGRIGFGYSDLQVEIDGRAIDPAEFLWSLMWARHRTRTRPESEPLTAVHVEAWRGDEMLGARTVLDARVMGVGTGLGAAAAVLTSLESTVPAGAHGPEVLDHRVALGHFLALSKTLGAYPEGIITA